MLLVNGLLSNGPFPALTNDQRTKSFSHHIYCTDTINSIISWHIKVNWCFISSSCLAEEIVIPFVKSSYMLLKSNKLSWKSAGRLCQREVVVRDNLFVPIICTHQEPVLAMNWYHVKFCDWASSQIQQFAVLLEISVLRAIARFSRGVYVCQLQLSFLPLPSLNFLAALQLFVFWALCVCVRA